MEKTYVFDSEGGGLNSSALIASLMQNKGIDGTKQITLWLHKSL